MGFYEKYQSVMIDLAGQPNLGLNTNDCSTLNQYYREGIKQLQTRTFELNCPIINEIPTSDFDTNNLTSLNIQQTATQPTILKDIFGEFC